MVKIILSKKVNIKGREKTVNICIPNINKETGKRYDEETVFMTLDTVFKALAEMHNGYGTNVAIELANRLNEEVEQELFKK